MNVCYLLYEKILMQKQWNQGKYVIMESLVEKAACPNQSNLCNPYSIINFNK